MLSYLAVKIILNTVLSIECYRQLLEGRAGDAIYVFSRKIWKHPVKNMPFFIMACSTFKFQSF